MLPADGIARAAARWLRILGSSTVSQGWSLIRSDTVYTDLTQTQYALALDWLRALEVVNDGPQGLGLSPKLARLSQLQRNQLLFERALGFAGPPWLADADILIQDATDLPQDALRLAATLDVTERTAFDSIHYVHGKVDLAQRTRVGLAGEKALVNFLEAKWPGSTVHVAATSDGFGYDVQFTHSGTRWYLEVKSTTRRGRLVFYLSRHEHEVALREPNWRIVVVGLDDQLNLQAVATVRHLKVLARAPTDTTTEAKWQATSHELMPEDLELGLSFVAASADDPQSGHSVSPPGDAPAGQFAWLPTSSNR